MKDYYEEGYHPINRYTFLSLQMHPMGCVADLCLVENKLVSKLWFGKASGTRIRGAQGKKQK